MHQFLLGIPGITMTNNISSNAKSSSPMFETMVNTTGTIGDQCILLFFFTINELQNLSHYARVFHLVLQKIPSAHNDGNTVKSSTTHNRPAPSAQYGSGSIKVIRIHLLLIHRTSNIEFLASSRNYFPN